MNFDTKNVEGGGKWWWEREEGRIESIPLHLLVAKYRPKFSRF